MHLNELSYNIRGRDRSIMSVPDGHGRRPTAAENVGGFPVVRNRTAADRSLTTSKGAEV